MAIWFFSSLLKHIYLLAIQQNPILTATITIKTSTTKTLTKIKKQGSIKRKRKDFTSKELLKKSRPGAFLSCFTFPYIDKNFV